MYPYCVHPGTVSGMWVSGQPFEFICQLGRAYVAFGVCRTRAATCVFANLDERTLPSGFAELEQLHVELNSEHSTSSHCSSTHYRRWKAGQGLEMRLGYEQSEPSGLAVLVQLHVVLNSEHGWHIPHSQTHYQATPTHVASARGMTRICIPSNWRGVHSGSPQEARFTHKGCRVGCYGDQMVLWWETEMMEVESGSHQSRTISLSALTTTHRHYSNWYFIFIHGNSSQPTLKYSEYVWRFSGHHKNNQHGEQQLSLQGTCVQEVAPT